MAKRRKPADRRPKRRLNAATLAPAEWHVQTVPKRWVKFLVGIFLLPPVWILSKTFFGAFAWMTLEKNFLNTPEFWFFSLGVAFWLLILVIMPKPMRIYIFGHEITHALCVWLMGGRVERIHISSDGGHVIADKINTLIALAPYFIPIYSVLALLVYGVAGIFTDMSPWLDLLLFVLGATWAFHITFTCWMIPKGQTDLEYGGQFFSLVVIYLANLILLSVLLVLATPEIGAWGFLDELVHNTSEFSHSILQLFRQVRAVLAP